MSTFGNSTEIWVVAKRGSPIGPPASVWFYTTEYAAMAHAKEIVTREMDIAIYRCSHVVDVVIDGPRVIDHRPKCEPA